MSNRLGLAIVKPVRLRHQARLGIESASGTGSVFRCQFSGKRRIALQEDPQTGLRPR